MLTFPAAVCKSPTSWTLVPGISNSAILVGVEWYLVEGCWGFFKILFTYFLERGRKGEREGEKHHYVVAFCTSPTVDLAYNPGMRPDWESNWPPFGLQADTWPLSHTSQGSLWFLICLSLWLISTCCWRLGYYPFYCFVSYTLEQSNALILRDQWIFVGWIN